jgi:hypothetical protein
MRTLVLVVAVLLVGCASFQNTRQQDLVENAWRQCQLEGRIAGNVRLTRIAPDGRYWYASSDSAYGFTEVRACISEKYAELQRGGAK